MKELYIAPEMKFVCFAPVQRLASTDPLNIDLQLDLGSGEGNEAGTSPGGDLGLDLL